MTLLIIDPGHGGTDRANRGPTGYVEADGVLDISLKLRKMLADAGYSVKMTREKDETVALYSRAEMANRWKGDLLISIHSNAAADTNAGGIETFHTLVNEWNNQNHHAEAKRVADIVQKQLVSATGLRDRGIKTRLVTTDGSPIKGKDFYAVIRRSNMAALIVEVGFHSNPREEALLKTEEFRTKAAVAIFEGIKKAYPIVAVNLTPIQGVAVATLQQAREWLQQKAPEWVHMADLFYSIAPKYNIRPDVALCQACKETGFFRFGGIVKPWQNNWCGLAATGVASDGTTPLRGADPTAVRFEKGIHGAIFSTPEIGVEAQIQHLYAYVTKDALPSGTTLYSPRFTLVQRGTAPYVEYLGAGENPAGVGWAYPGLDYGQSIVKDYLKPLLAVKVVQEDLEEPKKEQENVISKSISLSMHGRPLEIDGLFMNGRNYIPVAFLRQLGYKVDWNSEKQMVEIEYMTEDK